MARPELSDEVLDALITLSTLNGRTDILRRDNKETFYLLGEEMQKTYIEKIKPVLAPVAEYYIPIQKEMERRERIFEDQKRKPIIM